MKYKSVCVIGGGTEFCGFCDDLGLKITYNAGDCYRIKEINSKTPKLNKTTKIYAEMCVPICDRVVVRLSGQNKII